jgi:F-type H+-transporting ATPase subunit delta
LKSASLQYANALADIALAQGAAVPVAKQLGDFGSAYAESAELRNFLSSPAVSHEAKHGVIEKIAERLGAGKIIRNFLYVIVDHQRSSVLPEIIAAFQQVIRRRQGIAEAEIISVTELSAPQKADFTKKLESLSGKKVETQYSLDPALLGGAVVRLGDTVFDGSVRSRLDRMREKLTAE